MELSKYMSRRTADGEAAAAARIMAGGDVNVQRAARLREAIEVAAESFDDATALEYPELYPGWTAGADYTADCRVRYGGGLYRCLQAHTGQADWAPDAAASLWTAINETNEGTLADPIPYEGNMALEQGLYYIQDGVVYLCIADTINPVYHALSALVGLYVEEVV